ncbi:uncharacterized protein LOC124371821 [Homalodisca vitripennis]|uniref:uncharacterized protein LOC124371821 n=1 Tax=Homalodisca vitripennis TaxID=197043 RepID=UPI001EECC24A|nr:uncharacterized protein LOC124371821 [Homalodisca vitripennis]
MTIFTTAAECAQTAAKNVVAKGWEFLQKLVHCAKLSENIDAQAYEEQVSTGYSNYLTQNDPHLSGPASSGPQQPTSQPDRREDVVLLRSAEESPGELRHRVQRIRPLLVSSCRLSLRILLHHRGHIQ